MQEISQENFLNVLYDSLQSSHRYCFILGAGASVSSGIPQASTLAKTWVEELRASYTPSSLQTLMKERNIQSLEPTGANYFNIYELRFHPHYSLGAERLQTLMEQAKPSYGYYPLVRQLAGKKNNLVITTNFDTLIQDALFIYTAARPICAGHESLAEFLNLNSDRPLIAQIHRGLFFDPRNRSDELAELAPEWKELLYKAFAIYTPVVIGYAGNDHTLMNFLKEENTRLKGVYWCILENETPNEEIKQLVQNQNGYFVRIKGFDDLMYHLASRFDYPDPTPDIKKSAEARCEAYRQSFDKLKENADAELSEAIRANAEAFIPELKAKLSKEPENCELLSQLAYAYYTSEDWENAIVYYDRLLTLQPDNIGALFRRGTSLSLLSNKEKNEYIKKKFLHSALDDYNKALELQPDDAATYCNRGILYKQMDIYEKALQDYNKALELRPDDAAAYGNRANLYSDMGESQKALDDYNKALELQPDDADTYFNRGILYKQIDIYEKALQDYNKVLELRPDYAEAYCNRGNLYSDMGASQKALDDYNKALELRPDHAVAYCKRGILYNKMDKYEKALDDYNKAIGIEPNRAITYFNRGSLYREIGENEKADADFKKYQDLLSR